MMRRATATASGCLRSSAIDLLPRAWISVGSGSPRLRSMTITLAPRSAATVRPAGRGRGRPSRRRADRRGGPPLVVRPWRRAFPKKAAMPCDASAVSQVSARRRMVSSIVASSIRGPRKRASDFAAATAPGAADRYGRTCLSTAASNSACGTTSATSPIRHASAASKMRADMKTRRAMPSPRRATT